METAGSEADDKVPGTNRFAIEHSRFFDDADHGTADVVFAGLVEAGHLSGFATDQSAFIFGASFGEAFDDVRENARFQFASAEVVEEEERFSAEDGDVVNAMVDEVLTDGVVTIERESEFEFCADAINAGDEDGLFVFSNIEGEETAEAADFAEDFRPVRGGEELRQGGFDFVAEVDVHAGACIRFLFHLRGQIMGKRGVEPRLK